MTLQNNALFGNIANKNFGTVNSGLAALGLHQTKDNMEVKKRV